MTIKVSGIYTIQSISHPDRFYVGSTVDMNTRWWRHKNELKKRHHHSNKLQRHYDKYGVDDLIFDVVETNDYLGKNHILSREQGWYDRFQYNNSNIPYFNISPTSGSLQGRNHTPETKEKIRKGMMGKQNSLGVKRTQEAVQNMIEAQARFTPEQKKEIGLKISKAHTGYKMPPEIVKMLSEKSKGRIPWNKGIKGSVTPNSGSFKKGMTPWNKGKHRENTNNKLDIK